MKKPYGWRFITAESRRSMPGRAEHPSPHGVVDVGLSGLPEEFKNRANPKTVLFQTGNLRNSLQLLLKGVNWIQ